MFEKLGLGHAHSKEELDKILPASLIKRVEKTMLGKRISANGSERSNKRMKTAP